MTKLLVTPDSVALPANQSVNIAQINGITPLMGAGNTGTGSPRVTIASDQASIPVAATLTAETTKVLGTIRIVGNVGGVVDAATGAAPPANVVYVGGRVSGATAGLLAGPIYCDNFDSGSISVNTQIVTGVAGRRIYFCSFWTEMNGGANTVAVVAGTGTTCATTTVRVPGIGPANTAANSFSFAATSGIVIGGGANGGPVAKTSVDADNVCIFVGSATLVGWGASWAIL